MFNNEALINALSSHLDTIVFGILGIMSIILIACVIERIWVFSRIKTHIYKHRLSLEAALTKQLTTIANIGSIAPYIGLLGTVLGIMVTFYQLGQTDQIDAKSIMSSLALALKATAGGLLVAIPAMFCYNQLMRKVEVLLAQWVVTNDFNNDDFSEDSYNDNKHPTKTL